MATVKKAVIKVVKKVASKAAKKKPKVVEMVSESCGVCGGRGLLDQHTLCAHCAGSGTV